MSKTTITLFFTYGVSIKTWAETGLLQREIRLYQELMRLYEIQVQFLTFGDETDRKWEAELRGIKLLPIYEKICRPHSKILSLLQTLIVPWVFRHELRKSNLLKTNQIWGGWIAVLTKWLFRKPLLVRCGYEFYHFSLKQRRTVAFRIFAYWTSRLVYSKADKINVATISDKLLLETKFGIDHSRIELLPNWVDTELFKPLSKIKNNRVLFVGRLNDQKNIPLLLESLQSTGIMLDLVGDGELFDSLEQMVLEKEVKVNFFGNIPNDLMPELYNRYPVYVLCSRYEGNPKTLLEAMACGCAVVGTNVDGIREIIRHRETGLLVSEDVSSLRTAIQLLIKDEELRRRLGEQSCKYIKTHNSLKATIKKEYDSYQKLCSPNSIRSR